MPQYDRITGEYRLDNLRSRHIAIMELMLLAPDMPMMEVAERVGLSYQRTLWITRTQLFKLAFEEFRKKHQNNISDLIVEATSTAIRFNQSVIENDNIDVGTRQASSRQILEQGHAKATERRANLSVETSLPAELIRKLIPILKEESPPVDIEPLLIKGTNGDRGSETSPSGAREE